MRVLGVVLILLCLLVLAGPDTATAQQVLGPFCLSVGPPVNATFTLLVPVVTSNLFQIVGTVFGDVPVGGSGFLNDANLSRFTFASGATAAGQQGAPISVTGTLDPNNPAAPGTGICFGGSNCGLGTSVTLQLVLGC